MPEIPLDEVRKKIEELKRRAAMQPDFGKKTKPRSLGTGKKQGLSKEEKEEFKKWKEAKERE